jgi:hypothetical protein
MIKSPYYPLAGRATQSSLAAERSSNPAGTTEQSTKTSGRNIFSFHYRR